jgi:capsid protein
MRERTLELSAPARFRANALSILDEFGRPIRLSHHRPAPRATYDAARNDNQLKEVWNEARGTSGDAEASPQVRATLRNRAAYELRNNAYLRAMVDTRALYVVGRLPRLQLDTSEAGGSQSYDEAKQASFNAWAGEVRLGQKLRLCEILETQDGECFLALVINPRLRHPVKLDIQVVEAARVTGQMDKLRRKYYSDGIEYDEIGNPLSYDVLKEHPGGSAFLTGYLTFMGEYENKPAGEILHRFRPLRAQKRGVCEIGPAFRLGAQLRRYTLAVLTAAENVASFSWLLYSEHPQLAPVEVDPMDAVSLEYGSGLTLPAGWKMAQMQAQQPASTYREFKREILNEMGRCLYEPNNISLGDSSAYNYSSGRLDHQAFFKWIDTAQYDLGLDCSTIYARWNDFYQFTPRAQHMRDWEPGATEPHTWHFDGIEHVDPYKEAMAQQVRLANKTTNLSIEWARQGLSAEEGLRQMSRDQKLLKQYELLPEPGSEPRNGEGSIDAVGWVMAERIAEAIADRVDPERIAEALANMSRR